MKKSRKGKVIGRMDELSHGATKKFRLRCHGRTVECLLVGYILVLDSLNYRLRGTSLLSDRRREFLLMLPISAIYWYVFESYNLAIELR